jgi:ferritin-like metal-binding protein YciE
MAKDLLSSWLKDAYGMEKMQIGVLEHHIKHLEDLPSIRARYEQHLEDTREQIARIESVIEARGEKVSGLKNAQGTIMGIAQNLTTSVAKDEIVKNALGDIANEHFEIACYRALRALAVRQSDIEVMALCDVTIPGEQAMATYLEEILPEVVGFYATEVDPEAAGASQPAFGESIRREREEEE